MERVDRNFVCWFDTVTPDGVMMVYRAVAPDVYKALSGMDFRVENKVVEDMGDLYRLAELGEYVYEASR